MFSFECRQFIDKGEILVALCTPNTEEKRIRISMISLLENFKCSTGTGKRLDPDCSSEFGSMKTKVPDIGSNPVFGNLIL